MLPRRHKERRASESQAEKEAVIVERKAGGGFVLAVVALIAVLIALHYLGVLRL